MSMLVAGCAHDAATAGASQTSRPRDAATVARVRQTLERCTAGTYSRSGLMYQCETSFVIIRPDCPVHPASKEHEHITHDLMVALAQGSRVDEACPTEAGEHCSRIETDSTTFRVVTASSYGGARSLVCGAPRDAERSDCDARLAELAAIDTRGFFEPSGSPPLARTTRDDSGDDLRPRPVLMSVDPVQFVEGWQAQMTTARTTATARR
jgi:hypothetical protein